MNFIIETLNQSGGNFLNFAWPMLWQSSLLIGVLFAMDLLLRHKLRASIRYALWLVVLVKLCVPPTIALPTSPAWWLHKTPKPVVAKSLPHYTVTYDNGPLPETPTTLLAAAIPPKPVMTSAAWLLTASSVISSTLLLWLLVRWWQIARLVRRAAASERLTSISDAAQKFAGMRLKVQVKLTTNAMSPAVCGLFRPAILIPQSLAENFSDEQLRAVLLHELIHLRRRDLWLNFVQSLLQIVYWWHPLVWLANAHIRRVREEAVDDAVMLALRDEAESYAPTLLEVARLALDRPLVTMGLVGIMESRHALRQRIERLVDFRPPRKAGLTFASFCGICAFSAVALPMGDAPSSSDEKSLPATSPSIASPALAPTNTPQVLIQAEIYQMRQADFEKLVSDPSFVATRQNEVENFRQFNRILKSSGFQPIQRPRILTNSGRPAELYVGDPTNSIEFECRPVVTNGLIDLTTRITMISTAKDVTTTNQTTSQTYFENGGGHVFSIKTTEDAGGSNIAVVTIGTQIVTNQSQFQQRLQTIIKRAPAEKLFLRDFKVDRATFTSVLEQRGASPDANTNSSATISAMAKIFFAKLGVNWESPGGKSISFDDGHGILSVRATQADLHTIEQAGIGLNEAPPQIHIKARFLEVPKGTVVGFGNLLNSTNSAAGQFTGILNDTNARTVLHSLESRKDVQTLAESEVVTTSGRQTQVRATEIRMMITNFVFEQNLTNSWIQPQTAPMETGSILDVVPKVLADESTIDLKTTASQTEFWGYAFIPTNAPLHSVTNSAGEQIDLPLIWPAMQISRATANVSLRDGQTLLLALNPPEQIRFAETDEKREAVVAKHIRDGQKKNKGGEREIIVFITATLVDPAGNRIYADGVSPVDKAAFRVVIPPK